jgi:phage terminase small subunit
MARKSQFKAQQRIEAFARQYVILKCNGTEAAIACGFSRKTADRQASRLLKNVKVKGLVASLLEQANKKLDISVERTLNELARCAYSDVRALFNADGSFKSIAELDADIAACIEGVEVSGRGRKQRVTDVKLWSKLQALRMIGQYQKLFADDRNPVDLGVKIIVLDAPRPNRVGFSNAGALPAGNGKPHDDE